MVNASLAKCLDSVLKAKAKTQPGEGPSRGLHSDYCKSRWIVCSSNPGLSWWQLLMNEE